MVILKYLKMITIAAISDLHGTLPEIKEEADILLIAGDIMPLQTQRDMEESEMWFKDSFLPWTDSLPIKYVVLVGGNHDLTKEHKICAFVLDRTSEKQSILLKLSRMYNKKYFFASNNTENRQAHLQDRIAPSVESWLDSFDSADVIFTDSFHGCAFSIIFRKYYF